MPGIRSARVIGVGCAALLALALSTLSAGATSRIKDLANIEGVRQNQLIGYGLVVGLNGTGDTLNNIPFTKQSLQAMLERMGVNIRGATIRTGNVAAVMVTGNLPAFGTQGTRMDVTVSSLGDAKNLQGGTLLVTPLLGADGNVYAVAQGNLTVTISESPQVSQPNPLSRGRTVVTPRSSVSVAEDGKKFAVVKDGVSLQQLVDGLNGLGIGPRDLIGILQAIKAAGAIQADIEVM